ncbi:MAG: threonine/serine dehydratase [Acidimicrobiia bacterium]
MHQPVPLEKIQRARENIRAHVVRTPVIQLEVEAPAEIYLKLENLQPIGSFKLRGAGNAIAGLEQEQLTEGVWTASAGNMAQGVAWHARRLNIPCTVVVPETTPASKRSSIERLGASLIEVPVQEWLDVFRTRAFRGLEGLFIHAFSDPAVMAGNGTIGLEIIEDVPDLDAIVVPFGGGGLVGGIASAIRSLRPETRILAAEFAEMAPLAASWEPGHPVEVPFAATFIDGIGAPVVYPEMLDLARQLLDGVVTTTVPATAAAVRLLAERGRVIAEGAGAVPVAAALSGAAGEGKVVCVVSGGNIDMDKFRTILQGGVP